jgi:molecular chaperone GrpE (heat shock protein)
MFERQKEPEDMPVGRDDKEYEHLAQRAAVLLANSFKVLTDDSIKKVTDHIFIDFAPLRSQLNQILNKQQEILDQIPAKLAQLETLPAKVQTNQQQIIYSLERIEKQMDQLIAGNKLLENASQENRLLSQEHYQDHIVQPMVRSLLPVFDFVEEARNGTSEHSNGEVQEFAEGLSIQLQQFLAAYQIEPIQHQPGAKFDPREMRPVKTVSIHDKQLADRVARSLQAGFRCGRERLLRPESIALYKYREPKSINQTKERV